MVDRSDAAPAADQDPLPTDAEWQELISAAEKSRPLPVRPLWIDERWAERRSKTFSRPTRAICAGKRGVYIKPVVSVTATSDALTVCRARSVVNEQIAGKLGALMNAPIAEVVLVEIDNRVRCVKRENLPRRGLHHGSWEIPNVDRVVKANESRLWRTTSPSVNRSRFAQLAVLFGWLHCTFDHQFAFEMGGERRVWSFDHGYTLGFGRNGNMCHPNWDEQLLRSRGPADVDVVIHRAIQFSAQELAQAVVPLASLGPPDIAGVVASVPDEWHITEAERVTVADYLERRRRDLLGRYQRKGAG